jgi:hypothetical protein
MEQPGAALGSQGHAFIRLARRDRRAPAELRWFLAGEEVVLGTAGWACPDREGIQHTVDLEQPKKPARVTVRTEGARSSDFTGARIVSTSRREHPLLPRIGSVEAIGKREV